MSPPSRDPLFVPRNGVLREAFAAVADAVALQSKSGLSVVNAADVRVRAAISNIAFVEIDRTSVGRDGKDDDNHQCGKVLGKVHDLERRRGTLSLRVVFCGCDCREEVRCGREK